MFHIKVHIKSETIITHDQEQYQEQKEGDEARATRYEAGKCSRAYKKHN